MAVSQAGKRIIPFLQPGPRGLALFLISHLKLDWSFNLGTIKLVSDRKKYLEYVWTEEMSHTQMLQDHDQPQGR